jgi:Protein of unknown function (DUF3300)
MVMTRCVNRPGAFWTRIVAVLSAVLFAASFAADARSQQAPPAQQTAAPQQADAKLSNERLEQLVAPIALYPDSLLAQVLMASTYPLEIVQAARWAKDNPKLKGKALEDKLVGQPWDASVKSIVAVPQVLTMMNDKVDWTQNLGNAFLAQQEDVLAAVQRLRVKAEDQGTLKSTQQQTVRKDSSGGSQVVVIEPTNPEVVYVPSYDPGVVYGAWPYPAYPPYSWYPPGYVASNFVSFGLGVAAGAALWGNCNWGGNNVDINVNRYNNFNRTNISNSEWRHDSSHRKGVSYGDSRVAERYGKGTGARDSAAREQFRGRAESGNLNLGDRGGAGRDGPGRDGAGPGRDGPGRDGAGPGRDGPGRDGPGRDGAGRAQQSNLGSGNRSSGDRQGAARQSGGAGRDGRQANAFSEAGNGSQARRDSSRGQASRQASQVQHRAAAPKPSGGGRVASGGGGGRSFSGGGGGGRSFGGGGGRGGGGRGGGGRR